MSDHKLAEALRNVLALIDDLVELDGADIREAREALAAHEAEQQAGEAVGACLKVIKGELCYRSRDEDQSFGMWVPVAPDSDHGFNNGAEFAPVAAHPQQPLKREQQAGEAVMVYHGQCTIDCGENGHHNVELLKLIPAGTKLFTRPQQPLTEEQIRLERKRIDPMAEDMDAWSFKQGVRFAERAHGIGITKDAK